MYIINLYCFEGSTQIHILSYLLQGVHWEHVNSPQSFIAISTCNYMIWAVGRKGELYYRDGSSKENISGSSWKLIETPKCNTPFNPKSSVGVKCVSLTKYSAWVLLSNGLISVRTDITQEHHDGKHWKYLTGIKITKQNLKKTVQQPIAWIYIFFIYK